MSISWRFATPRWPDLAWRTSRVLQPFESLPLGKNAIAKFPIPSRTLLKEDDADAVDSETPHLSLRYGLVG